MKKANYKAALIGMAAAMSVPVPAYAYNWQCGEEVLQITDEDAKILWDSGYQEQDEKTAGEIRALLGDLSGSYVTANLPDVDANGNPIDWDINAAGGEEGAGLEESIDLMEGTEISEKEKESIAAVMETAPQSDVPAEKGSLKLFFQPGKGWGDYTVGIALYNSAFKKTMLYLYPQNDYELTVELPVGHYQIHKMEVPGDDGHDYPIVYDKAEFDVTSEGLVQISAKSSLRHVSPVETMPEKAEEPEVTPEKKHNAILGEIAVIIAAAVVVIVTAVTVLAFKDRNRYE